MSIWSRNGLLHTCGVHARLLRSSLRAGTMPRVAAVANTRAESAERPVASGTPKEAQEPAAEGDSAEPSQAVSAAPRGARVRAEALPERGAIGGVSKPPPGQAASGPGLRHSQEPGLHRASPSAPQCLQRCPCLNVAVRVRCGCTLKGAERRVARGLPTLSMPPPGPKSPSRRTGCDHATCTAPPPPHRGLRRDRGLLAGCGGTFPRFQITSVP